MSAEGELRAPRETAVLIGHAAAERRLAAAARSGRLPHAWLIGGPFGVGKATLAYRFARFLLAGAPAAGEGLTLPPEHPVFRRVAAGGHSDLLTLERPIDAKRQRRTGDLPIDEIRRVPPFLHLTSGEGGWRVVIVDEAERLNRNSANALLKVLEEPPERALLLLVSASPGALPPTLRSRCRRLMLDPLPEVEVLAWLDAHQPEMGAEERLALARLAQGSIGRAAQLATQGGLALYRAMVGLLEGLPRVDVARLHKLADQLAAPSAEESFDTVAALLEGWLARLVRQLAGGGPTPEIVAGEARLMQRLSAAGGLDRWIALWEKTAELFRTADSANLDRRVVILHAFASLEAAARA